ncbi:hypothetical protein L226DRAFT_261326 [Lentinus tigrinus ALCF2SS1-7]|uniref:Uncharacterized protein n=1 Tax=Lentinus tigrinus ALCF2SS1-6 TaxID=1328759 RepID=A0A5C2RS76_9APHY|nr:hypothetical protein L227DRAFT_344644 [Lentinus tigrinus ALCF2SS1-6]RPD70068.1 hypothetical protein L226DRAFT_261326 [Lentinus tigrinus ALCF2SS1-7]
MDAWVSHAGIFSATIKFNEPLQVAWVNTSGDQVTPGSFSLDPLKVKSKRAYINQTVPFTIADEAAFSAFTSAMITQPNFTWHLTSDKLDVRALAFPTAHGLHFKKDVTLNGMNNFGRARLARRLQAARDDPAGGIVFSATTGLDNSSAFNVNLGTGSGANTVIKPGSNAVTLDGRLVPQTGTDALATTFELFTKYLNGEQADVVATGKSSIQADGRAVSWLSAGLTALELHVPFVAPGGAVSPIKAITIGDMSLEFSTHAPWAPVSNSRTVLAAMELPFGFGLEIEEISNRGRCRACQLDG